VRRLLLSLGLAVLAGGIAVAANADQPFAEGLSVAQPATHRAPADRPLAISDLPIVDQPTPDQPQADRGPTRQPGARTESACRREELLVKFAPGADATTVAGRHGATVVSSIPRIGVYVLAVPPGAQAATLTALAADPEVEYAEPNGVVRVPELPPTADPCAEATPSPAMSEPGGPAPERP